MSFFGSFPKSSASSRSVLKTSSHMRNKVKTELTRLAVISFKTEFSDGRSITEDGQKYLRLIGELGDAKFARYSADPPILSLKKIYCCRRGFEQLKMMASGSFEMIKKELKDLIGEEVTTEQADRIQKNRGLINHEYLVLELQASPTEKLHILAEKIGGKGTAGIYIQKAVPADYDEKQVGLLAIDCGGVPMKLDSLQNLLKDTDTADYDFRYNNCWDYAIRATKAVLNECIAGARSGEEAERLKKELQNLEANLTKKGIVNTWKKVSEWYSSCK